ncbi:Stealth CR1 domain-containing protein [Tenacibaculum crassostreae]|uniref:Stealth CR1 domain-containing protein n=1 Tax=Tenacibaculum crassostreae TaxID=502683 RepID=UPI00389538CB
MGIDFVVTWVDMDDPKWIKEFSKYSDKIDNSVNEKSEARFRDHGFLRYWFRGIEKFAPWVRKIHFVTSGQKPEWLDENHPKINLVSHSDYIPKEFLPVFNSNLIEIYMHKIPGLSEQFVYFNDDFFIINDVPETRFFENGLPKDIATFRTNTGISQFEKMLKNNIRLINKHFDKKEVLKRDHDKWYHPSYGSRARITKLLKYYNKFITLRTPHNAQPYLKSTFEDVWEHCGEELTEMSKHRFRSDNDYTPELFKTWQICKSNFIPYNTYQDTKMFSLVIKSKKAIKALREQSYSLVCLNDNVHIRNYEKVMQEIHDAFESILPEQSSFEK